MTEMKLTDNIRTKIGDDKLLHFLCGGLFTAFGFFFSWQIGVLFFLLMLSLSYLKESLWDASFNWKDILAAFIGGLLSTVIYLISINMTPFTKVLGIAILACFSLAFVGFIIYTIVEHKKAVKEIENEKK